MHIYITSSPHTFCSEITGVGVWILKVQTKIIQQKHVRFDSLRVLLAAFRDRVSGKSMDNTSTTAVKSEDQIGKAENGKGERNTEPWPQQLSDIIPFNKALCISVTL